MGNKLTFKHEQTETRQENVVQEKNEHNEAIGAELKAGGYYCQTYKNPESIAAKKKVRQRRAKKYNERKSLGTNLKATAAGEAYG